MQLNFSDANNELIGTYKSNDDWPEITITKSKGSYSFKWGELSGPILKSSEEEKTYIVAFGPLSRGFSVQKDGGRIATLTTGSLKYIKVK